MKHLYLPFVCVPGDGFPLKGPDFHYLTRVLRFREGDSFFGLDAAGKRFWLTVKNITADAVFLSAEEKESPAADHPPVCLYQSLPKGKAMDRIVRHATETGVTGIVPVISRYTVVDLKDRDKKENKRSRWIRIAKEAIQQSGSLMLPYISDPVKLPDAVKQAKGVKFFFHQEKIGNTSLHKSLAACGNNEAGVISVFTGCEGGFSDDEVDLMKSAGCIPVYAGMTVLRAETAALFALAAIKMILIEKEHWRIT